MTSSNFFYPHYLMLYGCTVAELKNFIRLVPDNQIILLWSVEYIPESELLEFIDTVHSLGVNRRVYWWLQPSHSYQANLEDILGDHLYRIDGDLLMLSLYVDVCNTCQPNQHWNSKTNRFMFLTGKPDRANRIRLLYKFYSNSVLQYCDWSLFISESNYKESKKYLPELTCKEFREFVTNHNRNLDGVEVIQSDINMHIHCMPFDATTYSNVSFKVISETQMADKEIITEKTWSTIMNKLPFIMAGYPYSLNYLKNNGYRTFEHLLPVPNYDQILDPEIRLDAIVTNTKFWINDIQSCTEQINKDVEHNFNLLRENIIKAKLLASELASKLNDPSRPWYAIVPLSIDQDTWVSFYYSIKDPAWPDCLLKQSFNKLPPQIKKECIDVFGYSDRFKH